MNCQNDLNKCTAMYNTNYAPSAEALLVKGTFQTKLSKESWFPRSYIAL